MALPKAKPEAPSLPRRLPDGRWLHKYGVAFSKPYPDWWLELQMWYQRYDTGFDPVEHLRRYFQIVHPECAWHEWRELMFHSLTDDEYAHKSGNVIIRNIQWVGCATSGKTFSAGDFAFAWWLADPSNSAVVLTSTSRTKIKQRVWPIIQSRFAEAKVKFEEVGAVYPHIVNSTMELQREQGDAKHCIFAQAVERGDIYQAVEKIKGVHLPRTLVVIDEAPGTPEAVYGCAPNWQKGCNELIVLSIGNGPTTHIDTFSKVCTPERGWGSVGVDTESWPTKSVPEFQLPRGHCFHFDGHKSPNVKGRKTLFPFLYTWENYTQVQADPAIQRTAAYYAQDRGFWPPEGFSNTVLSEELLERGNARGEVEFSENSVKIPVGSLDSGFGGDDCVLRFGKMGKLKSGAMAVQVTDCIVIPILVDDVDPDTGKKVPAEYQIAKRVMAEAAQRKVEPEHFGIEATGTGRGAAAVLTQQWGEIIWVESGGKPSDMPASEEDPRPSYEVYDRKITELWYSVRAFVAGGQIGGLTDDDVIQFCSRQYTFVSKKYRVETKEELKARLGRSPDQADSLATLIFVCRIHGMATQGPRAQRMLEFNDTTIELQQRLYDEDRMYQPEEMGLS